jgi:hypothetical protein
MITSSGDINESNDTSVKKKCQVRFKSVKVQCFYILVVCCGVYVVVIGISARCTRIINSFCN